MVKEDLVKKYAHCETYCKGSDKYRVMANRVNNWEQLLELANKDLKQHGVEMNVILVDETGDYDEHYRVELRPKYVN